MTMRMVTAFLKGNLAAFTAIREFTLDSATPLLGIQPVEIEHPEIERGKGRYGRELTAGPEWQEAGSQR